MGRRSRVVFLINSLAGGGAERVMCTLLRNSREECEEFDVTLALLDDEPAAYAPPDWVDVRQFDCRGSAFRSGLAVRRLFSDLKPDATVSFLTRANVVNVVNRRAPAIISERSNTTAYLNGRSSMMLRALIRGIYPRATRIVAVSQGVADDLAENFGVPEPKLVVIENPVDTVTILALSEREPAVAVGGAYILAAGRLVKPKNFDMLIQAFALAGGTRKLVIIGEGPERAALEQLAQTCGVGEKVMFPGFVENPYPLMRGADLFVLSSNSEGFPNALVEAMAVGCPVIATNCASGPAEILAESRRGDLSGMVLAPHGVIVPTDSAQDMAEALRAMDNDELRRGYGVKASARAGAYSVAVAKKRYWDVVRAALGEGAEQAALSA